MCSLVKCYMTVCIEAEPVYSVWDTYSAVYNLDKVLYDSVYDPDKVLHDGVRQGV